VRDWILGTQREISWHSSKDGRIVGGLVELPAGYETAAVVRRTSAEVTDGSASG
jgi:hypothetical protein